MKQENEDTEKVSGNTDKTDVVVEVTDLKKSFGPKKVLANISFKLHKGENLVVLGKSGSGKSVLIKCLVGLLQPDGGTAMVFGKDITTLQNEELNELRRKIGFLFQSAALYDSMTVGENVAFPLHTMKIAPDEVEKKVRAALKNVGLEEAFDKMPAELSGGMRKRVGLARTLILDPEIILYDEPTTGLDPITSREISNLVLEVQKKFNTASIIITHDIDCARITANRVMIIKEGVKAEEGTFDEISGSQDEWVRSFFQ